VHSFIPCIWKWDISLKKNRMNLNKKVQWFVGVENFGRATFSFFGYPSIQIAGSKLAWGMSFCFVLRCFSSVEISTVILNKDLVNWTVRGGPDRNTTLKIYLLPNNWTWFYIYTCIHTLLRFQHVLANNSSILRDIVTKEHFMLEHVVVNCTW